MHTLLFLEPGHFHAALLLKNANARISNDVHVYATHGSERDAFVALLDSFNRRADRPTSWQVHLHDAATREQALERLIRERRGEAVVLAGRNARKIADMARLHGEDFAVLADKPWVTGPAALPALALTCHGSPLAMDIMPDRHELLARLRKRVTATAELFGEFAVDDPDGPAIEITSVHHLYKVVNGAPLRRPAWYYDVHEQGDGMVDVQSHLTDQAQWLVDAARAYDFERDVVLDTARLYSTPVPRDLFRDSTGEDDFPEALTPWLRDGVLHYPCNSELRYRLCGVSVRQVADWGPREPAGGGDLHGAVVRGTRAVLEVEHGAHTDFVPQVYLTPRPGIAFEATLTEAMAAWREEFPGLAVQAAGGRFRFMAPRDLHSTHESHFARELARFLDYLDAGAWPADLQPRMHTRYRLLAEACALSRGRDKDGH
jgi:predicted dehydrogenase